MVVVCEHLGDEAGRLVRRGAALGAVAHHLQNSVPWMTRMIWVELVLIRFLTQSVSSREVEEAHGVIVCCAVVVVCQRLGDEACCLVRHWAALGAVAHRL